jgi:hypothetical protein
MCLLFDSPNIYTKFMMYTPYTVYDSGGLARGRRFAFGKPAPAANQLLADVPRQQPSEPTCSEDSPSTPVEG